MSTKMSKKKKKEEKEELEAIPDLSDAVRNLIGTEDMLLQKQKNLKHKIESENALEHCKKRYEEELQHINGVLKVVADQIIAISNLTQSDKEDIEAECDILCGLGSEQEEADKSGSQLEIEILEIIRNDFIHKLVQVFQLRNGCIK